MGGPQSVVLGFLGVPCIRVPGGDNRESLGAATAGRDPLQVVTSGVSLGCLTSPWALSLRCGAAMGAVVP